MHTTTFDMYRTISKYILHVNLLPYYNMHKKNSRRKLSFAQTSDDTATCELCYGRHIQFTAPEKWKSEEACTLVVSLGLSAKSLICSACRKDVTRCLSNDEYTPRWEKDISKNVTCFVRLCAVDTFTSLNKPAEVVFGAFQKGELQASTTQIPIPTPLCKHHYHMVYNIINPTQTHCVTCGMSLKHENPKPCPNPNKIEEYLRQTTGFDGKIHDADKICYTCYS